MTDHPKIDALDLISTRSSGSTSSASSASSAPSSTPSSTPSASSAPASIPSVQAQTPYRSDYGRHAPRSGASIVGTLSNWAESVIHGRTVERQRRKVSDRAADLYVNDAMAHGLVESVPVQMVNTGMTPQSYPMLDWLGMDQEWGTQYQQAVSGLFEVWGLDVRNWCDAHRRLNIYGLQALAAFMWKLEGIGVFQIVRKARPMAPLALTLLPIDSARLVTPSDRQNADVYDGFELGPDGDPVAAYIAKPGLTPGQYVSLRADQCNRVEVHDPSTGLPNLLIVCDVRNIAEYRQDSILGPVIKEVRDQNDFVDAALVKALISNLFTVFIQSNYQQTATGAVRSVEDRIQQISKGTIIVGSQDEIPHIINSGDQPGPSYEMMNRSILGRVGMSTGRGPENVSREYKASYSASQASIENAISWDDYDRTILVNRFCGPVHCWLQYEGALRGILPVRSVGWMLENLHAVTRTEWLPPKLRPIDKTKAANADDVRLQNCTRTWADIYGEQSRDWRTALRQRIQELVFLKEEAEKAGLTLEQVMSVKGGVQPMTAQSQPQPDPDQGDE